jgi:threonine dehydratase
MSEVSAADIEVAAERIGPHVVRTPLVAATRLSDALGCEVHLKPETLQETGSFKIRGATNAVLRLGPEDRARGVVTASSGNHGPALAAAARKVGVRCTVCLSRMVPENKVENVRLFGGEVHVAGRDYAASAIEARRIAAETGALQIPPFDHPDIVAGAGTVGLEIVADLTDVDTILVPLSGGGLLAGVAIAAKAARPAVRVVGVTMERGASMHASLDAGRPVDLAEEETLADALGGNIGLNNRWTFEPVRRLVDRTVLVGEARIAEGMHRLLADQGLVVEGAGAVGVAALLDGRLGSLGRRVAVVVSGRNVALRRLLAVATG